MRALLFDLDETLVEEEEPVVAALRATAGEPEARSGLDADALAATVRVRARELWQSGPMFPYCLSIGISSGEGLWCHFVGTTDELARLRGWAPGYRRGAWAAALADFGVEDDLLAHDLAERFGRERRARHAVFSDAVPSLDWARRHNYKLALITNGASCLQREKLAASQLERYFDVVVISGDFGICKPAVPIYTRALECLGIHAKAATMVGDSIERDIDGAHAAGIRGVWINRFQRTPSSPCPSVVIETLHRLPEALAAL